MQITYSFQLEVFFELVSHVICLIFTAFAVKRTRLLTGAGSGSVLQGRACSWQEQRVKVQLGQTHPKRVLLWEGRAAVWRCLVGGCPREVPVGLGKDSRVPVPALGCGQQSPLLCLGPAGSCSLWLGCSWLLRAPCGFFGFLLGGGYCRTNPPRHMCSLAVKAAAWCSQQWISQGEKFVP